MYLKSIQMKNFRKYREENNTFTFVSAESIRGNETNSEKEEGLKKDIDVASATTLIVGKNNTGKTSVIQALLKIINNNENYKLQVKDINFYYLRECFQHYLERYRMSAEDKGTMLFQPPLIEFVITIAFEKNSDDVVTNLVPFMLLRDIEGEEIQIIIKYEISEIKMFEDAIFKACKQIENINKEKKFKNNYKSVTTDFQVMLRELEKVKFQMNYYQRYVEEGEKEPKEERIERNFKLYNLMKQL